MNASRLLLNKSAISLRLRRRMSQRVYRCHPHWYASDCMGGERDRKGTRERERGKLQRVVSHSRAGCQPSHAVQAAAHFVECCECVSQVAHGYVEGQIRDSACIGRQTSCRVVRCPCPSPTTGRYHGRSGSCGGWLTGLLAECAATSHRPRPGGSPCAKRRLLCGWRPAVARCRRLPGGAGRAGRRGRSGRRWPRR